MTPPFSDLGTSARSAVLSLVARISILLSALVVVLPCTGRGEDGIALLEGFQVSTVFDNLDRPVSFTFAPNGQVFVAEKSGIIKVYEGLDDTLPSVFADLREQVFDSWDRGVFGIALDPAYPVRPYLYVIYTVDAPLGSEAPVYNDICAGLKWKCPSHGRLSRLTASGNFMVGNELVMLDEWCGQYPSHHLGDLIFGDDGSLYLSSGDGASWDTVDYGQAGNACGDPPLEGGALRSQDLETSGDLVEYTGTILRLDPDTGLAMPDNPLVGGDPQDDPIVAYGFRNPFSLAISPSDGSLWIGEVGWGDFEEINRMPGPFSPEVLNFGWPCYEGFAPHPGYDAADIPICENLYTTQPSRLQEPFFVYRHDEPIAPGATNNAPTASITGLMFYETGGYPDAYDGALFYSDYTRAAIAVAFKNPQGVIDMSTRVAFATGDLHPVDLQLGPAGDLYYADIVRGEIRAVRYFDGNQPPVAEVQVTPTSGALPLQVTFDASASTDPEQGPLSFAWDLDCDGFYDDETLPIATYTYTWPGYYHVGLEVTDAQGAKDTSTLLLVADNQEPLPYISQPTGATGWQTGQPVSFFGGANDPEEGALSPDHLFWRFMLITCDPNNPTVCHERFIEQASGTSGGSFIPIDFGYPGYIEVHLTATDSGFPWWKQGWARRCRLAFQTTGISEPLVNVPVPVHLTPDRFDYALGGLGGRNLRFIDPDGTFLAYEIESWNPGGTSTIWVKIPRLEANSVEDFIWMYFGNPVAISAENPAALWQNEFSAVWHMNGDVQDASGHGHHGTLFGGAASQGLAGEALDFDGVDDYARVDYTPALGFAANESFTLETWAYIPQPSTRWQCLAGRYDSVSPWYGMWIASWGPWVFGAHDNNHVYYGQAAAGWHYVCAVQDGVAGQRRLYVDGVLGATSIAQSSGGTQPLYMGATIAVGNEHFNGRLDEMRLAPAARSASWVLAQYRGMQDNLIGFGPMESRDNALSKESVVTIDPDINNVTFDTSPFNLTMALGEDEVEAPYTKTVVVGSQQSVGVPAAVVTNGLRHLFGYWSDDLAREHTATMAPSMTSLVATYIDAHHDNYDWDGDHVSDLVSFLPGNGNWFVKGSLGGASQQPWGWAAVVPVRGDYDGDNVDDLAVFWPAQARWYIQRSSLGYLQVQYGPAGSVPVPGDYDSDGVTDLAVYHKSSGRWYIRQSRLGNKSLQFGWSETVPVPADYDGDGKTDPAVFYPPTGRWFCMASRDGYSSVRFGWGATAPVPADYDGDGKADKAVFWRQEGRWFILQSTDGFREQDFGWGATIPVPADYEGDQKSNIAVYHPASARWYVLEASGGVRQVSSGPAGSLPVHRQYWLNKKWGLVP